MANSILSTRISLRHDSYSNWTTKNPVLLKGEAAICVVPANSSTGLREPALLMKVGEDGVKKFNELPWLSALSADTNEYARLGAAAFEAQIKAWATETSGREYQIVSDPTTGAYSYKLQTRVWVAASGETAAHWGEWTDVPGSVINLKDVDDRLDTAEGKLDIIQGNAQTTGSIAMAEANAKAYADEVLANAVDGLDATVTQTAGADGLALEVVEANGKLVSVTGSIAANTYDAYGDAAAAEANAKTYTDNKIAALDADKDVTGAHKVMTGITEVDGVITAIDEVELQNVAYTGNAADVALADANGKITATTVEGAVEELKDAITQEVSDRANAITAEVSARNNAITTAIEALDKSDITGFGAGKTLATLTETDGIIAATFQDIDITSNHVTDAGTMITKNAATVDIGAEGQIDAAYPNAGQVQTYVEQKIADLGTGLEYLGMAEFQDEQHPEETIDECIARIVAAKTGHVLKAGDMVIVENYHGGNSEFIYNGTDWEEFGNTGLYATKSELSAEANARSAADLALANAIEVAEANAKTYTDTSIDALDATVKSYSGEEAPATGIAVTVTQANGLLTGVTAAIPAGTYDTYGDAAQALADAKDYANGILANAVDSLDGNAIASANAGNVFTVLTGVTEVDGIISKQGEVTLAAAAKTGAAADVSVADANGKFTAANVEAALEELYDDLTTAIDGLDGSANATAVDANGRYSVLTSVVESNGVISKGDEVKLEKIATTGNVNDLIQTAGDYLILDGGNASSFSA